MEDRAAEDGAEQLEASPEEPDPATEDGTGQSPEEAEFCEEVCEEVGEEPGPQQDAGVMESELSEPAHEELPSDQVDEAPVSEPCEPADPEASGEECADAETEQIAAPEEQAATASGSSGDAEPSQAAAPAQEEESADAEPAQIAAPEEQTAKATASSADAEPSSPAREEQTEQAAASAPASTAAGANTAPDRGLAILHKYEEFKEMGCPEAASAVLRQGLRFCPDSAVLKALAEKEGIPVVPEEGELTGAALMEQLRRREMMMHQMHVAQQRQRMQQIQQWQAHLHHPRYTPPPTLPEPRKGKIVVPPPPTRFFDELEYPDKKKATRGMAVIAVGALCGLIFSILEPCSAYYIVWSFLACHLALIILLRDYGGEWALLLVCAVLAFHGGHALAELGSWLLAADGADSLGPWSIVVIFACFLYLQSYLKECVTLPPDYISTLSFFFPVFPAYDAAVALSCLEFFLEWKYFPDFKLWTPIVVLGLVSMAVGQGLVTWAARVADRNFWASTRELEEDELVGLEIPNRRVVREGPYAWERHPAYMGALLWGLGTQLALCNPAMLVIVAFVLWASLLHVTMEEEKELFDEFPGLYVNYSALTSCWIPGFPPLLENSAFQREMDDNAPEQEGDDLLEQEESEEEIDEEDDLLPTWEGVPKGGAIWNRQFQEPWRLG